MDPILVSVEEAARLLSIGRSAAYELLGRGELPHVKIGRRTLIPVQALYDYAERVVVGSRSGTSPAEAA